MIATSIDNIHEKLERKNAENMMKKSRDNQEDDADGIQMSVNLLKQKLRFKKVYLKCFMKMVKKFKKCEYGAGNQWDGNWG